MQFYNVSLPCPFSKVSHINFLAHFQTYNLLFYFVYMHMYVCMYVWFSLHFLKCIHVFRSELLVLDNQLLCSSLWYTISSLSCITELPVLLCSGLSHAGASPTASACVLLSCLNSWSDSHVGKILWVLFHSQLSYLLALTIFAILLPHYPLSLNRYKSFCIYNYWDWMQSSTFWLLRISVMFFISIRQNVLTTS